MDYVLKGTISLVPGDNLASQYLGGYKGLASALRKCRQCMAVDDGMQSKVSKATTEKVFMIIVFTYHVPYSLCLKHLNPDLVQLMILILLPLLGPCVITIALHLE